MPDSNILFQVAQPANMQRGFSSAMDSLAKYSEHEQMPLRNKLLESQVEGNQLQNKMYKQKLEGEYAGFALKDMALDAMELREMLNRGDMMSANVKIAQRIKKLQDREADPSDTIRFRDALNSGSITPEQAINKLGETVNAATRAGVLEDNMTAGMREWQQMTQGFSEEDQARARRIAAGLDPRAVTGAARTVMVGDVPYTFDPNTQSYKPAYIGGAPSGDVLGQPIDGGMPPSAPPPPQVLDASAVAANAGTVAGGKAAGEQAIKMSGEALQKLPDVRRSISNIDQAIAAVDSGANTGVIASKFPSVTAASVELDNLRGSMGLDVIAGTTFGALSEAELGFALETAMPTKLDGPDLKKWLQRKKDVQTKLAKELEDAAIYLGKPGNTPAGWLEMKRNAQSQTAKTAAGKSLIQEGATATNPQTGQKIIYRGGQWQPL